jgi:hypothetical protein
MGKRGLAPSGKGLLIGVRFQPNLVEAIDAWINVAEVPMSRPEAVRRLLGASLLKRATSLNTSVIVGKGSG